MLRKNVKSLLEQFQVCIFAEIVFGVRCTLSQQTDEIAANEIWQFPLLIHLNAKAIQSCCIRETNIIAVPVMQQKHFISHPDQTRHARSRIKLRQTSNRERSKTQIVLYTRALR